MEETTPVPPVPARLGRVVLGIHYISLLPYVLLQITILIFRAFGGTPNPYGFIWDVIFFFIYALFNIPASIIGAICVFKLAGKTEHSRLRKMLFIMLILSVWFIITALLAKIEEITIAINFGILVASISYLYVYISSYLKDRRLKAAE